MQPSDPVRRLAAVWFADIVGYTALSNRDEDAAMRIVGAFQDVSRSTAEEHGGRVVKFIGDAVLTEFSSTDGALRSALDVLAAFEALDDVKSSQVALRIGLHVGEVVGTDDGDIYGDGVNFASRLETAATPGRIFVSDAVRTQVRQRPVFETRSVGPRTLKGLPRPVEVFEAAYAGKLKAPLPPMAPVGRPTHMRRSRAIALGMTVAITGFSALVVWSAFLRRDSAPALRYQVEQFTYTGTAEAPRFSPDGGTLGVLEAAGRFGGNLQICEVEGGSTGCDPAADGVTAFDWSGADSLVWERSGAVFAGSGMDDAERLAGGWGDFTVESRSDMATRVQHARSGSVVLRQALGEETAEIVLATPPGTRIWETAWSPDGKWLLFTFTDEDGIASLRLLEAGAAEPAELLTRRVANPRWGPDSQTVYFLHELGRARLLNVLQIDRRGELASGPWDVPIGRNIEGFDIAANGLIAFTEVQRQSNLVGLGLEAGAPSEALTSGTARVSWPTLSPDAGKLAFVRNGDVFVRSLAADEQNDTQLTQLSAPIAALRWSPDGDLLAFILQEASQRTLHVIDADPDAEGDPRQVPLAQPLPYDLDPELTWARGGDAVVYVGADNAGWPSILSTVDTRTEGDELLIAPDSQSVESFQGIVASPDGTRVVLGDGFGGLRFVTLDDGTVSDLYLDEPGLPIHWSQDGRIVVRSILNRAELLTVDLDTGRTESLASLPEGCDQVTLNLAAGRIVCSVPSPVERDVWLARPAN